MHGGPAFTHNYMIPLKLLARKGHPVIFYDQAGCGASFVPTDLEKHPELLTIQYYVKEAHALVEALNIEEYAIYGSSWGSILA
jgi:pimeloyl-ACP methyl ester carboxylesterase